MENTNDFAGYILGEKDFTSKLNIMYYFKKNTKDIFFDNTVVFKAEIARMFIEKMKLTELDENMILTACMLYACKKLNIAYHLDRVKSYAVEGAEYLETLGFSKEFCLICKQVNRYVYTENRTKEGDFLELIDNFGMLLHREDRMAFSVEEALFLLEYKNLIGRQNAYLDKFKEFVMEMENVATGKISKNKLISKWQQEINMLQTDDLITGIRLASENRMKVKKAIIEGKKIERNKDNIREYNKDINEQINKKLAEDIDLAKRMEKISMLNNENVG